MNKIVLMSIEDKLHILKSQMSLVPGISIVQDLKDSQIIFMSQKGLDQLGIDLSDLRDLKGRYEDSIFKTYEVQNFEKELKQLLKRNDSSETFTFFQQVKPLRGRDWAWHIGSIRIFHRDIKGKPTHILKLIFPVERMEHVPQKAKRLVKETTFFEENKEKFDSLGSRARDILRLVALGKTSAEISAELNIKTDTVNTHRRNIKRKLQISNIYEFTEYARAYDLI